jgi:hypothetical protein
MEVYMNENDVIEKEVERGKAILLKHGQIDGAELSQALGEWRQMVSEAITVMMVLDGTLDMFWQDSKLYFGFESKEEG